jgi:hypothetical protein
VWDFHPAAGRSQRCDAHDISLTAESSDGQQNVEYSGALEAATMPLQRSPSPRSLQEIVKDGSLRMTRARSFPTGQALLDWLKATNQPFNVAKVSQ